MTVIANPPYPSYFDVDGSPLEDGYIYFGAANQNPETNPITVYWDAAYTQPALQPIRTSGGFTYRAGTPANIYVSTDFSITVRDKNRRLVYSKLLSEGQTTAEVNLQYSTQSITATTGQTVFGLSTSYTPGNNSLAVYHNGSRLIVGSDYTETSATVITLAIGATAGDVLQFVTATPINPSNLGAAAVAYIPAGAGAVATNVQDKLRKEMPSAFDYLSVDQIGDVQARARSLNVVTALQAALNAWAATPGGTLVIPPGDYYLGSYATSAAVLSCTPPRRGRISAYGARFIGTTTAVGATPFIFRFTNPDGVVFEGGEFLDLGFDNTTWLTSFKGAGGVNLVATTACDGFTLRDARGENLTYLVVSDQVSNRNLIRHVNVIDCKLKMAYYGVDMVYAAQNVDIRGFECEDVRRGFISYGQKNATVDIKLKTNSGFLGSNAFVLLACEGEVIGSLGADANVENIRVDLTVSGFEAHTAYVHFYHQQNDSTGSIKNVRANVLVNNLSSSGKNPLVGATNIFLFDHELPSTAILGSTTREFKNIDLSGGIIGTITGVPVKVDSVNSASPHTIALSEGLTAVTQTLVSNNLTNGGVNWLTAFERPLTGLVPVGTTTAGTATGLTCSGTWTKIGRRVFITAKVAWTGHTGTGFLRLNGLPLAVDSSIFTPSPLSVISDGLAHTANTTLVAFAGGTGNTQVVLLEDNAGVLANLAMDTSVTGLYVSGSYLTTN